MKIRGKPRGFLLLVVLVGLGAWANDQGYLQPYVKKIMSAGNPGPTVTTKDFEFKKVTRKDMHQTVLATGSVSLKTGAEVKIGSRISGQLKELYVQIGDFVQAGDVIAIVEHDDLMSRVAQRKAELKAEEAHLEKILSEGPLELGKIQAEIEELQFKIKLSKKMLARNRELNRQGVVSATMLDQAEEDLNVLGAQVKLARENLKLKRTQLENDIKLREANIEKVRAYLEEDETRLSYATITAPIDGIVASISTQKGETVAASMSAPTFVTLIDLRQLEVMVFVDETDIGQVQLGQEALFTVDSYPDKFFKGVVRDIHPKAVIKDNVVNYEVILEIAPASIALLRPEMTANVVITTDKKSNVLAIPKQAIKRKGKKEFVTVNLNGRLAEQPVTTGWRDEGFLEVLSGLSEGDRVGIPIKPKLDMRGPGRRRRS
ncbi:MAG: efflux RND transporter periplasmic adaptor subunit [Nitrospinales bacterium]